MTEEERKAWLALMEEERPRQPNWPRRISLAGLAVAVIIALVYLPSALSDLAGALPGGAFE